MRSWVRRKWTILQFVRSNYYGHWRYSQFCLIEETLSYCAGTFRRWEKLASSSWWLATDDRSSRGGSIFTTVNSAHSYLVCPGNRWAVQYNKPSWYSNIKGPSLPFLVVLRFLFTKIIQQLSPQSRLKHIPQLVGMNSSLSSTPFTAYLKVHLLHTPFTPLSSQPILHYTACSPSRPKTLSDSVAVPSWIPSFDSAHSYGFIASILSIKILLEIWASISSRYLHVCWNITYIDKAQLACY